MIRAGNDKRPSVCVFTRIWRGNGTGLFAQGLAEGLVEAGADVIFICPRTTSEAFEQPRPHLTRFRQPRERDGASKPVRVLASIIRMVGGALSLARARMTARLFIISLPDPFLVAIPVLWLLRLSGATVLLVAHDPVPHAWKLSQRLRRVEIAGYRIIYSVVSAVVVLSEPSRTKLFDAFPTLRRPVAVIDHGPLTVGKPRPLPGNGQVLCFGTLRRNKGIVEAIEGAAAACGEGLPMRLVIAGDAHKEDPAYAEQCVAKAQGAGACIDMRFDYVADDAVEGLLAESDVLLLPYSADFHSQSGVAMLAASNGRPVIATGAGGLATLLDEGMPGIRITEPVTAESVREALVQFFATSRGIWSERVERYRATTFEKRSWPVVAARYLAVGNALVAGRAIDAQSEKPEMVR